MLSPGTRLGPYTILDLVAVGGMGEVYRAEDSRLHRDVAIKVLPARLADDRASLERFRREARAVAALSHPNILSIFDFGVEGDIHYAVMELLEGDNLRALMRRQRTAREALELMLEVAEGVAAAHARGIVHRDLKPENIFITREGRVKVLDFGIARTSIELYRESDAQAPTEVLATEPGMVIGTVGYLAPEQVEARAPAPAADVFALGCILYELLAGRVPFERASSARALVAVLHDDAPRLSFEGDRLLRDIDALVQRCLEKDPEERPRDAGALAGEIRALLSGQPLSKRRRKPLPKRLVIGASIVIVILVAWLIVERVRHRQIDNGYDIRVSDIRGDAETKRLIELALEADASGNRAKAGELLEEAHRRGNATAIPAAFLASFGTGAGDFERAEAWGKEAMKRLQGASTYESLLTRYLLAASQDLDQELALSKSMLEIRPDAWRLRLSAAHIHLERREREAAARELRQIDISKPDDRRLMLVLADRASLGDHDGAERDLRASRIWKRPALRFYTEGRIAWSRGNPRAAAEAFDKAADEGIAEALTSVQIESRVLAGAALLRQRSWAEAQRRFSGAAAKSRQTNSMRRLHHAAAFGAYAAHRLGDPVERDRKLQAAMSIDPPVESQATLRLLAIRMRSSVWKSWNKEAIDKDPQLAATAALIRAREAWYEGDLEAAARELGRARAEGIDASPDREEAELLAFELGLPWQILPADPPYPNVLRYLAIFELEERAGANLPR